MAAIHALSHGEIENFLLQITVLLLVAYVGGRVVKCWKQPSIVGNILGGIFLGPSILGHWLPDLQILVFKPEQTQANMLSAITWVGLLLFLMEAGLDVNLNVLRRTGKQSFLVSAGGLALPLVAGFLLGFYIPESLLIKPSDRLALSLFLAVSMSISALPPVSMVLREKNMIRSHMGQIALGAAMLDDIVAWILVAVMTSLYLTGHFDLLTASKTTGAALIFLGISYVIARPLMTRFIVWHNQISPGASAQLSVLIFFGITGSLITSWLGLEFALGIFVVGIVIGAAPSLQKNAVHALSLIISSFLAPLYFGLTGLRLDLWTVFEWHTLGLLVSVLLVAFGSKLIGVYLGAWAGGLSFWERITLGFGLNSRGGTEIIIATVGLSIGLLPKEIYSIIVVMAIVTVILSVPLMTWALSHLKPEGEPADPCALQFICEETLVDPHTALDAVEKEEIRLAKKLKDYCQVLRKIPRSNEHYQLDNIALPFHAISASIEGFQKQLASQTLCPGTSSQLIRLQNELGLLRYLQKTIHQLCISAEKIPKGVTISQNFSSYVDTLDSLLDAMIDALRLKNQASLSTFTALTNSHKHLFNRLREDSLGNQNTSDKMYLFEIAYGFEQALWLLERMSATTAAA